jgi:hypothetical protein
MRSVGAIIALLVPATAIFGAGTEVSKPMPARQKPAFSVWVAHSMDTVFRDTPVPARRSREISLMAAGGEYESAQVVIVPEKDTDAVAISATVLAGPKGDIARYRVQCRFVGYQWVEENSKAAPPEEVTRKAPAWFPDPLLEERCVSAKQGENQPLLVTVSVPRNAAPGIYRGAVRLQADRLRVEVPLTLEVLTFSLPNLP